jgi:hypothetical protein
MHGRIKKISVIVCQTTRWPLRFRCVSLGPLLRPRGVLVVNSSILWELGQPLCHWFLTSNLSADPAREKTDKTMSNSPPRPLLLPALTFRKAGYANQPNLTSLRIAQLSSTHPRHRTRRKPQTHVRREGSVMQCSRDDINQSLIRCF